MTEAIVAPIKLAEALRLAGQALLLDDRAYATVYDAKYPLRRGFTILLVILLTVGVALAIGLALDIVVTPRLDLVETAVFETLTETTWYQETSTQSPDFATSFKQLYTVAWQIAYMVGQAPSWLGTLTGFLVTLIVSLLSWFIYGSLAYGIGRWLGGQGNYQQFMGTLALAYAPKLLLVAMVIPGMTLGGIVAWWLLLTKYQAVKHTYNLSWERNLAVVLIPYLIIGLTLFGLLLFTVAYGLSQVPGLDTAIRFLSFIKQ
ncbi:MAG: YIP1 family protein [Anaerolineae bacterium]|nr:YIP1 family protein [Anaerolineae bacterium]